MTKRRLPQSDRHIPSTPWVDEAACKGKDSSMWFPMAGTSWEERKIIRMAVEICTTCPVKDECLDHSLAWEHQGVWGGKTQREREILRRTRNIKLSMVTGRAHS